MSKAPPFPAAAIEAELTRRLTELALPADAMVEQLPQRLTRFLAELAKWNRAYNLTAVRDPLDMVPRHILDSLTVLPWISGERVADIGTGAGLPGIPLAMLWPNRHFTLLDSNGKKVRFVTHAAVTLGLDNVLPVQERSESYESEAFDTVVCRAFTALPDFVAGTQHLLADSGALVAMKGRHPAAEIAALPAGWEVSECAKVVVPGLDAQRHIVVLRRSH